MSAYVYFNYFVGYLLSTTNTKYFLVQVDIDYSITCYLPLLQMLSNSTRQASRTSEKSRNIFLHLLVFESQIL